MRYATLAALVLGATIEGCTGSDGVCLTLPTPVVQADIRDASTDAPAAYQASLIVSGNGVYDSTFAEPRPDSLQLIVLESRPPGRTGDYTVRVRRNGYQVWQQAGVHVEGSGCAGARSIELSVRLQPLP